MDTAVDDAAWVPPVLEFLEMVGWSFIFIYLVRLVADVDNSVVGQSTHEIEVQINLQGSCS